MFNSMKSKLKKKLVKRLSKSTEINSSSDSDTEINDSNEIEWLESTNKKFNYSNFKDIQLIGSGSFASVVRATLNDRVFALKFFNNDKTTLERVVREVTTLTMTDGKIYYQS